MVLTRTGDVWAYYKIKPQSITSNNIEELEKAKRNTSYFFQQLRRYKDFHLEVYPKDMNLRERFKAIENDFAPECEQIGKYYSNETITLLEKELGRVCEEAFVVGVLLKSSVISDSIKETVMKSVEMVTDSILTAIGYEPRADDAYFEKYYDLEKELESIVRGIEGAPLTQEENIYINRYSFLRSIDHSVRKEQQNGDVFSVTDTVIDPSSNLGYLELKTAEGSCFVSFVPVAKTPVNVGYLHLFQTAEKLLFPVELHIKARFEDIEKVGNKAKRTKLRFKQSAREAKENGDQASNSNLTGRYLLTHLQNEVEKDIPQLKWQAVYVVSASTKKLCKKRVDSLIRVLGHKKIKAVRPIADQLNLFYACLHAESLQFEKNWLHHTNVDGLAENLFAVSNRLGNTTGFYLGRVDNQLKAVNLKTSIHASRKPVLFNPTVAAKGITGAKTDSPHIGITGETGKGKTYLVKDLLMHTSFLNAKILYVDPKKEVKRWFSGAIENEDMQKKYPLFVEHLKRFNYVTLDVVDRANWGVLDPICFLKGADAKDTAEAMIEQIYNTTGKDLAKTAILKSLSEVFERREKGEKVGLLHVVELLRNSDEKEIRGAGELIHEKVKGSILQLAFSDGSSDGLNLTSRMNILEITGLELPKETDLPSDYSDLEKKSIALMLPLGKFCEKFGSEDPSQDTVIIFDEAWIFASARGGKKILKSLKRVGRSFNNILVLVTQSVEDVSEKDDHGNFGTIFAFDEPAERKEILRHLGIEVNEKNIKALSEMLKGQCFYKDIYGRVGKINIHCPFEEMDLAFKTNEKNASAIAEELFAS